MPVSELRRMFNNIAGADGLISKPEFETFLRRFDGYRLMEPRNVKYKRDEKRDGMLNGDEFFRAVEITGFNFERYVNDYTSFSNIEIKTLVGNIYDGPDGRSGVDKDKDGQLSFAEFKKIESVWGRMLS